MKIITKAKAFYKGELLQVGRIIEYAGKKLPSWAIKFVEKKVKEIVEDKINKDNVGQNENKPAENVTATVTENETTLDNVGQTEQNEPVEVDEYAGKDNAELLVILDALITKAVEKGLTIDTSNLSTLEAIKSLKKELGE